MKEHKRYHLNAPGPFYVEDGRCITCMAPHHAAPDLMGLFDDPSGTNRESHCFFKAQPKTSGETEAAIEAVISACCGALRYGGKDRAVIEKLPKEQCDQAEESNAS